MSQNDYHPQGMNGYGQPNTYYQSYSNAPQNAAESQRYQQNAAPGQNRSVQGFQAAVPYSAYNTPAAQGYTVPSAQGRGVSGAPAGPGYNAPAYQMKNGYTTPQVPFVQGGSDNYANNQNPVQPYAPVQIGQQNNPYAVPTYSIPPQNGNGGSFIPQTPYSPGYTSPGYQPPQQQGYQAGYNPYVQMGKSQPDQAQHDSGIPLNGGGYVPQKVPVRRRPFVMKDFYLVIAGAILIALFAAAVIITGIPALKILLIVLALGSAAVLWVKPLVAENKRLTYSILAMALCILTAVSFMMRQPNDTTKNETSSPQSANSSTGNNPQEIQQSSAQTAKTETTATPVPNSNELMTRLVSFFIYWSENRQDEMLALCAPSWVDKQENPRTSLFILLGNRKPADCTPESISGTDADSSRKVTLTSKIERYTGKKPELYRMTVLMVKENNEWFVDPQSLQSYDTVATPDPNVTETPSPTPTAAIYSNTILYYNPNGGEYYHFDANCRNVGSKNRPLAGQFTYAEINDEPYSKLKPCNVCGAPLRP